MPKDPTRNIQSYQIQGGHLNEFEYQQDQAEMAHSSELQLPNEGEPTNPDPAARIAEVTAAAHRKVEKRKRLGLAPGSGKKVAARKSSAKKVAKKAARKAVRKAAKKTAKKAVTKSAKKPAKRTAAKKRASTSGGSKRSAKKATKTAAKKKPNRRAR